MMTLMMMMILIIFKTKRFFANFIFTKVFQIN